LLANSSLSASSHNHMNEKTASVLDRS
jgi:hypothetical protein